jgi:hypothetical protein
MSRKRLSLATVQSGANGTVGIRSLAPYVRQGMPVVAKRSVAVPLPREAGLKRAAALFIRQGRRRTARDAVAQKGPYGTARSSDSMVFEVEDRSWPNQLVGCACSVKTSEEHL